MKIDHFILAILYMIALAFFIPELAHLLPLDSFTGVGISLIFFFYGLKLSPEKLKSGLSNWRLHILVQTITFIIFPLVVIAIRPFFLGNQEEEMVWLGLLFLGALPSTVSSSVVMVAIAKGNIPAAIFNASISGLIGIAVTPLWMGLFSGSEVTGSIDFVDVYTNLLLEIFAPVLVGLLLRRWLGAFAQKYSSALSNFDKSVILAVIYKSFVHSFESGVFASMNVVDFLILSTWVILLFILIYGITMLLSYKLKFNFEDQITALFCGTKKSLTHGTVFSKVLFATSPALGIILLPIMLYHAFQILIISVIAGKYGRR